MKWLFERRFTRYDLLAILITANVGVHFGFITFIFTAIIMLGIGAIYEK